MFPSPAKAKTTIAVDAPPESSASQTVSDSATRKGKQPQSAQNRGAAAAAQNSKPGVASQSELGPTSEQIVSPELRALLSRTVSVLDKTESGTA